jgi:NAD(P)H-dependent FMN reductase
MKLAIIVGATREGRKTLQQAKWVFNSAKEVEGIDAELVDLKDYPMPFFDEPVSPRYNPNRTPVAEAKKWLDKIAGYDAYIFVTPEYNHSVTGVLKNALDYVTWEFVHKPVAVVSHGSAGGARAMTDLKEILSESKAAVIPVGPSLAVVHMSEMIDENGVMSAEAKANPYGAQAGLNELLTDIKWYSDALSAARAQEK